MKQPETAVFKMTAQFPTTGSTCFCIGEFCQPEAMIRQRK
jgi:hypothetical protein